MKFYKRAALSITRRKGKSFILFAVIFILGNVIAGAISIQEATTNVEQTIKKKLGSIATIGLDYQKLQENFDSGSANKFSKLDEKKILEFGKRPEVKYFDYNLEKFVASDTIKKYAPESESNGAIVAGNNDGNDFKLKGVHHASVLDFKEKKANLVDGRTFTEEEIKNNRTSAIISKKMAEENNLSVGDTFTMKNKVYNYGESSDSGSVEPIATQDISLEVIGIFEPTEAKKTDDSKGTSMSMSDFMNTAYQNTIYVPNEVVKNEVDFEKESLIRAGSALGEDENYGADFIPTYVLKSPESSESFKKAIEPQIPKDYKVTSSSDQYKAIAAPIQSMSELANYVLIAALGATILIIGLVVLLFLRDRKHEFGIYLSLGERRKYILGQVLLEVMTVAFIAVSLSIFTGNILASNLSDSMIQSQMAADAEKKNAGLENGGGMLTNFDDSSNWGSDVSTKDVSDSYQVKLDKQYIGLIYAISLSTILLSTILPVTYIVRLNPKKIML